MQADQRRELEIRLEQSRCAVRKAVENLTDPQWRFAPPEGGWTIAQCLEHVTHIETQIIDKLEATMQMLPPDESWMLTLSGKEELLKQRIPGRERKVLMPQEFDYPQGETNSFVTYEGTGGIRVGGFLRRLPHRARALQVLKLPETAAMPAEEARLPPADRSV